MGDGFKFFWPFQNVWTLKNFKIVKRSCSLNRYYRVALNLLLNNQCQLNSLSNSTNHCNTSLIVTLISLFSHMHYMWNHFYSILLCYWIEVFRKVIICLPCLVNWKKNIKLVWSIHSFVKQGFYFTSFTAAFTFIADPGNRW